MATGSLLACPSEVCLSVMRPKSPGPESRHSLHYEWPNTCVMIEHPCWRERRTKLSVEGCSFEGRSTCTSRDGGRESRHLEMIGLSFGLPPAVLTHVHARMRTHARAVRGLRCRTFPHRSCFLFLPQGATSSAPLELTVQNPCLPWVQVPYFIPTNDRNHFCNVYVQTEEQVRKYFVAVINWLAWAVSL